MKYHFELTRDEVDCLLDALSLAENTRPFPDPEAGALLDKLRSEATDQTPLSGAGYCVHKSDEDGYCTEPGCPNQGRTVR